MAGARTWTGFLCSWGVWEGGVGGRVGGVGERKREREMGRGHFALRGYHECSIV